MSLPIARVVKTNGMVTLQDAGRQHSMQEGVTEGGVMDVHAAYWANKLLGKPKHNPVIEITLGMFELEMLHDCRITLTGANLQAKRNDQVLPLWQSSNCFAGDKLVFQFPQSGLRAYLTFDAELAIPQYFGSVSTVAREQLGGLNGNALQVDDVLYATEVGDDKRTVKMPTQFIPDYNRAETLTLDVLPSYQFSQFSDQAKATFTSHEFQINTNSTRMAYLLEGEPIKHEMTELASEGIAYGAIQIPPDGQPVVLLNDRQTMGGYPKIGCVTRLSGARLAQSFAPKKVAFRFVEREKAVAKWRDFNVFFNT